MNRFSLRPIRSNSTIVLFLLVFLSPALWSIDKESIDLNDRGMEYYYIDDFITASLFFLDAIEVDDTNYLAHYNLACTMCLIREKYSPCDMYGPNGRFDVRRTTILHHLTRSVALKESRRERLLEDSDLSCMHTTLAFHRLAGRSLTDPEDAQKILPAVTWTLEKENTTSDIPSGTIDFHEDRTLEIDFWGLKEPLRGGGSYTIAPETILLDFSDGATSSGRPRELTIEEGKGLNIILEDQRFLITNRLRECGD